MFLQKHLFGNELGPLHLLSDTAVPVRAAAVMVNPKENLHCVVLHSCLAPSLRCLHAQLGLFQLQTFSEREVVGYRVKFLPPSSAVGEPLSG